MKRAAVLALAALVAACGGSDSDRPTVFAAASLTEVFQELDPDARFNFAGSDELATQLREGAEADVYAAASPRYPEELFAEGLVEEPRAFATNRLVLIVPAANDSGIETLGDLDREGVKLVVGAEGVPIGDYTREVLDRAGASDVLDRVVSEEQDVKGVVGKVALGEADAGFVYATDARAAGPDVRAIELPTAAAASADIRYLIAVVRGGDRGAGEAFVDLVLGERGRAALAAAGFGLP
jgi:molybdate transport system substrate-binding protein